MNRVHMKRDYNWQELIQNYEENINNEYATKYEDWIEPYSKELEAISKENKIVNKGASSEALLEAQKRLNTKLPNSYIDFLKYSNGLLMPDMFVNLLPIEYVDWFYNLNQEWVDIWLEGGDEDEGEEYRDVITGNPVEFKVYDLKDALQISDTLEGDVLLLNPNKKRDGEWEGWWFSNAHPGVVRYENFYDMLNDYLEPCEDKDTDTLTEEEYKKLREKAEKEVANSVNSALASILENMKKMGMSAQEIEAEFRKEQEIVDKYFGDMFNKTINREDVDEETKENLIKEKELDDKKFNEMLSKIKKAQNK